MSDPQDKNGKLNGVGLTPVELTPEEQASSLNAGALAIVKAVEAVTAEENSSAVDSAALLSAMQKLTKRIDKLDKRLGSVVSELEQLRKSLPKVARRSATKKQLKKIKKILDQLEVIEVADDPSNLSLGS